MPRGDHKPLLTPGLYDEPRPSPTVMTPRSAAS